jgi:hypothetical protein
MPTSLGVSSLPHLQDVLAEELANRGEHCWIIEDGSTLRRSKELREPDAYKKR